MWGRRVRRPLPGLKQSVYRAELLAVVRALEECQPQRRALQTGRRRPKGRNRDLEQRGLIALLPGSRIRWMKAHLNQRDVQIGRITADDFQGNQQADLLANQGTAQHGPLDPDLRLAGLCDECLPLLEAGRTTTSRTTRRATKSQVTG
eukprot:6467657-Amphidinium_carterae.2